MSRCRSCNAEIAWIETKSGKMMPCNYETINIVPDKQGDTLAVTEQGEVIKGFQVGDTHEGGYEIAHISHFATCPAADKFRKGG